MAKERPYPSFIGGEVDTLVGFLDFHRDTLISKITGLSERDARYRPTPTANSLLNLVVHMTGVERFWFQHVVLGEEIERDREAEFAGIPPDVTVASAVLDYRVAAARSNEIVRSVSLDAMSRGPVYTDRNVRWVVVHVLEETTRHAGHADITRELIDGATGL